MTALEMIAEALAMPKTHVVVTAFASGNVRHHETRSFEAAKAYANGERHKIGRDLIDRATGRTVRVTSVTVRAI